MCRFVGFSGIGFEVLASDGCCEWEDVFLEVCWFCSKDVQRSRQKRMLSQVMTSRSKMNSFMVFLNRKLIGGVSSQSPAKTDGKTSSVGSSLKNLLIVNRKPLCFMVFGPLGVCLFSSLDLFHWMLFFSAQAA